LNTDAAGILLVIPYSKSATQPIQICPIVSNVSQINSTVAVPVTHAAERRQNGMLVQTEALFLLITPPLF
jgi:hypothetical protein